MIKVKPEEFPPQEAKKRFEAALRAGLSTRGQPHGDMKVGKITGAKPRTRGKKKTPPKRGEK